MTGDSRRELADERALSWSRTVILDRGTFEDLSPFDEEERELALVVQAKIRGDVDRVLPTERAEDLVPRRHQDHPRHAERLRAYPGAWKLIVPEASLSVGPGLRAGTSSAYPVGEFEFFTIQRESRRRFDVYARYLGEEATDV